MKKANIWGLVAIFLACLSFVFALHLVDPNQANARPYFATQTQVANKIESALKAHKKELVFKDMAVKRTTASSITRYAYSVGPANAEFTSTASLRPTTYKLLFDRYGAYPEQINIVTKNGVEQIESMTFGYYFTKKQTTKANKVIQSVAATAKRQGSRSNQVRYIHDWVVKNTVPGTYYSSKWKSSKTYGVPENLINVSSIGPLVAHHGKCMSYSLTFIQICKAAGIKDVKYIICDTSLGSHAISAVKVNGKWSYVDTLWDDILYKGTKYGAYEIPSNVSHTYFLKSKSWMNKHDHLFK